MALQITDSKGETHRFVGLTLAFLRVVPRILQFHNDDAMWCSRCRLFVSYRALDWSTAKETPDETDDGVPGTVHDAKTKKIG